MSWAVCVISHCVWGEDNFSVYLVIDFTVNGMCHTNNWVSSLFFFFFYLILCCIIFVCLSFWSHLKLWLINSDLAHPFLLSVLLPFIPSFSLSLPHCLLFTFFFFRQSNPSSNSPSRPRSAGGEGGEGCSGWAFLLSLRWQRHRGAIDGSTGPHSSLMLECVISWQLGPTEIDCAEFLKCTVHFNL